MIVGSLLLIVLAVGVLVLGLLQGSDALLVASIGASLLAAVALIVGGRQAAAARSRVGRQVPSERYDPLASHLAGEDLDLSGAGEHARRAERRAVGAGARAGTTYGSVAGAGARTAAPDETAPIVPVRDEPVAPISQQGDNDNGRYEEYPSGYAAAPSHASSPYEVSPYEASPDGASPDEASPDGASSDRSSDEGSSDEGSSDEASSGEVSPDGAPADDDGYDEEPADEPPIQHSSPADLARVATLDAEVLVIDGRPRYHVPSCPRLLGRESEPLPAHEAVELGFTPCSACTPNDVLLAAHR